MTETDRSCNAMEFSINETVVPAQRAKTVFCTLSLGIPGYGGGSGEGAWDGNGETIPSHPVRWDVEALKFSTI